MRTSYPLFLLDGFRELIDRRAVRIVQPDLATAGGIRETKRIADYTARAARRPSRLASWERDGHGTCCPAGLDGR